MYCHNVLLCIMESTRKSGNRATPASLLLLSPNLIVDSSVGVHALIEILPIDVSTSPLGMKHTNASLLHQSEDHIFSTFFPPVSQSALGVWMITVLFDFLLHRSCPGQVSTHSHLFPRGGHSLVQASRCAHGLHCLLHPT